MTFAGWAAEPQRVTSAEQPFIPSLGTCVAPRPPRARMNALTLPPSWVSHSHAPTAVTHMHADRYTVHVHTSRTHTQKRINVCEYICWYTHTRSNSHSHIVARETRTTSTSRTPPHNKQLPASTSAALGAAFVSPCRFIIRGWQSSCAAIVVISTTGPAATGIE